MNFYPFHIGDYAQATRHLSLLEHGCYRALLDLYYSRETPLPADVATVQRLACARTREERAAVESVLREFFHETPEGWRHARCDREIEAGKRKQEAARENGKRGGRKPVRNPLGSSLLTQQEPTGLAGGNPRLSSQSQSQSQSPPSPPPGGERDLVDPNAGAVPPGPEDIPDVAPAVRLAVAAREAGVDCTGSDPRLIALAEQGTTTATLLAAIEEARRAKGGRPTLGYVVAVLESWAKRVQSIAVNGAAQPARDGAVIAHPSSATTDEALLRRISERNGGASVERLSDGRLKCGVHYYRPDGRQEVAI